VNKLAISNIAWEQHDDPAMLAMLLAAGVSGIEVAPTKVWPDLQLAGIPQAEAYRRQLADAGFAIPALQAILFGRPELQVFDSTCHSDFLAHIAHIAELAQALGARVLVFGAPNNRRRGQLAQPEAMEVATEFFSQAAELCTQSNCCIGLEHNPVEYGCDFVTNVADARQLVDSVDHPGLQLHLDAAGIHLCGGDMATVIRQAGPFVHYHISEPGLAPLAGGEVDHGLACEAVRQLDYDGWLSIEMKPTDSFERLRQSVELAKSWAIPPQ
jgi:sugar phosphate isomerase/epimerase